MRAIDLPELFSPGGMRRRGSSKNILASIDAGIRCRAASL